MTHSNLHNFIIKTSSYILIFILVILSCKEEEVGISKYPKYLVVDEVDITNLAVNSTIHFNAQVLDNDSVPFNGVIKLFVTIERPGKPGHAIIDTNADGHATIPVEIGPVVERILVKIESPNLTASPVYRYLEPIPAAPSRLEVVFGGDQEGPAGELSGEFEIGVFDEFGNGIPGVQVNFRSGHATLREPFVVTNFKGIASNRFNFRSDSVLNIIEASAAGISTEMRAYSLINPSLTVENNNGHIALNWVASVSDNFEAFKILRSKRHEYNYSEIAVINDQNVTSYTDTVGNIGALYTYKVRVVGRANHVESNLADAYFGKFKEYNGLKDILWSEAEQVFYYVISNKIYSVSPAINAPLDSITLDHPVSAITLSLDNNFIYSDFHGNVHFLNSDGAILRSVNIQNLLNNTYARHVYQAQNGKVFATTYQGYLTVIDPADDYAATRAGYYHSGYFIGDAAGALYLGEFNRTPNSIYKLNVEDHSLITEDQHGAVGGVFNAELNNDKSKIYTTTGQILDAHTLKQAGLINPGIDLELTDDKCFILRGWNRDTEVLIYDQSSQTLLDLIATDIEGPVQIKLGELEDYTYMAVVSKTSYPWPASTKVFMLNY